VGCTVLCKCRGLIRRGGSRRSGDRGGCSGEGRDSKGSGKRSRHSSTGWGSWCAITTCLHCLLCLCVLLLFLFGFGNGSEEEIQEETHGALVTAEQCTRTNGGGDERTVDGKVYACATRDSRLTSAALGTEMRRTNENREQNEHDAQDTRANSIYAGSDGASSASAASA
jgi:hypothetical protein